MSLDRALDISVSGVTAERIAMELIASNIANINTTRTIYGGPYRRKVPVVGEAPISFDDELTTAINKLSLGSNGGVAVLDVVEDQTPFAKVYKPGQPDADPAGFVSLPNVNLATETTSMIETQKLYEANIMAFNATKKMMQDTLQL